MQTRSKKIILGSLILAGLAFIIFSCFWPKPPIANLDSRGKNIICFGDSLTFGANVATRDSYPSVLSRMLSREIINAGVNGDTTSSALLRLERDVLQKDPLLVVVILGGNDSLRSFSKQKTLENITTIVRKIKSRGAMVSLGQLGPFKMHSYRGEYKKIARQENILLIKNILSGIFGHPRLMSDNIHPNKQGYAIMAQKVYDVILPALNENEKKTSSKEK